MLRTGDGMLESRDHAAARHAGREVVDRDHDVAGVERLLDRRLLLALRRAVVAGRGRLVVEDLPGRVDDLVVDVVDDVAADAGRLAPGKLDRDVHRALRVTAGRLADDARE